MARKRSLNVHNTDRLFNLNLTTKQEEANFIKVTRVNEKQIERDLDKQKEMSARFDRRDNKKYLVFRDKYGDTTIQDKIFKYGGSIVYYALNRAPIPIINKLAGVPQSEILFQCKKDFTQEEIRNIHLASMATKVSIDVPIVLPDINVYDYLFSLYPLRYHVDNVKISFPALREDEIQKRHKPFYVFYNGMYHLKSKYKYQCFQHLQDPLSTWKMNIWLICDSKKDMNTVASLVSKDHKRFQADITATDEGGDES